MLRFARRLRSARGRAAAIVCAVGPCVAALGALGAVSAGCFDRVSLGSGDGEGGSGGTSRPTFKLRFPTPDPDEHEVTAGGMECYPGFTTDLDEDGWTPASGDCNDCDPDVGPSAVEMNTLPGEEPRDEDCDGDVDEVDPGCDASLPLSPENAFQAADAINLCERAGADDMRWGVIRAVWVAPDGGAPPVQNEETEAAFKLGYGILDAFGPHVGVRHGARMLVLSTGTARQKKDDEYRDPRGYDKAYHSAAPVGLPSAPPACPWVGSGEARDGMALELEVRAPQNADGFAYDFDFYTYEFPERVCTPHNDLFAALLLGLDPTAPAQSLSFDAKGNAITASSALLEACACEGGPPCVVEGVAHPCSLGTAPLVGNGFGAEDFEDMKENRGATGWLTTEAAVERGSTVKLRFAIQDAGDGMFDSTVLIDHFRWTNGGEEPAAARARTFRP